MVLAGSSPEVVNAAPLPSRSSPEDIWARGEGGEPPHIVFAPDQSSGELKSMLSEPLLARDWRVQLRRLRSSRIPSSPQERGVSSKSHEAPGTYPESLVDRFKSSLFCRSF